LEKNLSKKLEAEKDTVKTLRENIQELKKTITQQKTRTLGVAMRNPCGPSLRSPQTQQEPASSLNEDLIHENENLKLKLRAQEQQIKEAQKDAFRAKNQGPWNADPDQVFQRELTSLESAIDNFSRDHAAAVPAGKSLRSLFALPEHEEDEMLDTDGLEALRGNKYATHMILSSLISRRISEKVFQDPLNFVREMMRQCVGVPIGIEDTLTMFLGTVEQST